MAPVIWYRTTLSTLNTASFAGGDSGAPSSLSRRLFTLLGQLGQMVDEAERPIVQVISIAAAAGVAPRAARRNRGRDRHPAHPRAIGLGVGLAPLLIATTLALGPNDYVTFRAAALIVPFVLLAAGVGWVELLRQVRRSRPGSARLVTAVGLVVLLGVVGTNAARGVWGVTNHVWSDRAVTAEFGEAAGWVSELGGPQGDHVTVAVGTVWDQLWLAEALSAEPDVSWINLRGDLGYRGNLLLTDFWDGEQDPSRTRRSRGLREPGCGDHRVERPLLLVDMAAGGTVAVPDASTGKWQWIINEGGIPASGPAGVRILVAAAEHRRALPADRGPPRRHGDPGHDRRRTRDAPVGRVRCPARAAADRPHRRLPRRDRRAGRLPVQRHRHRLSQRYRASSGRK